jgi:hypothetical protein
MALVGAFVAPLALDTGLLFAARFELFRGDFAGIFWAPIGCGLVGGLAAPIENIIGRVAFASLCAAALSVVILFYNISVGCLITGECL